MFLVNAKNQTVDFSKLRKIAIGTHGIFNKFRRAKEPLNSPKKIKKIQIILNLSVEPKIGTP
jgi:hypothetical protein